MYCVNLKITGSQTEQSLCVTLCFCYSEWYNVMVNVCGCVIDPAHSFLLLKGTFSIIAVACSEVKHFTVPVKRLETVLIVTDFTWIELNGNLKVEHVSVLQVSCYVFKHVTPSYTSFPLIGWRWRWFISSLILCCSGLQLESEQQNSCYKCVDQTNKQKNIKQQRYHSDFL